MPNDLDALRTAHATAAGEALITRNLAHDQDLMFDQRWAAAYPTQIYGDDCDLQ